MVRFGSADLWTSALGVKHVQGRDPLGPEAGRSQKRPKAAKIQKFATDYKWVRNGGGGEQDWDDKIPLGMLKARIIAFCS